MMQTMGSLHNRLNLEQADLHYSQEEHLKISKIAKFGGERFEILKV